jgi:hypothetical protein
MRCTGPSTRRIAAALAAVAVLWPCAILAQDATCRSSARRVGECFTVHGRLYFTPDSPEIRLWRIGTHRVLGVLAPDGSDQHVLSEALLERLWGGGDRPGRIYGEFEICPLSPDQPAHMQMACLASASRLFVERPQQDSGPSRAAVSRSGE